MGTVLADWRWATPLWVLQATEERAPTTDVVYVYPEAGMPYEEVWLERAEGALVSSLSNALYTTHFFNWDGWSYVPVGGGYRLYKLPPEPLPAELGYTNLEAELGSVRLVGYRWYGNAEPGRTIELQLAWQAIAPQEPEPSFTARLWDENEQLLDAADRRLGTTTAVGEMRFTQLTLQMPVDRCSTTVYPTLGAYTFVDGAIQDQGSLSLPPLTSKCRYPRLPVERRRPGVVLGRGPLLRGIDYDVRSGGPSFAYLHFCGPGEELRVLSATGQATVSALGPGRCHTIRLAIEGAGAPDLVFRYEDGTRARLFSLPLPRPGSRERYLPFGDRMILTDMRLSELRSVEPPATALTLKWRVASPFRDDYAVSTRLLDDDMSWLGIHDMQPGVGAIPTLKWVVQDSRIRDPHLFVNLDNAPTFAEVAVYERFRLTPLKSAFSDVTTYQLSPP
jgi:hypothetical protein